MGGGHSAASCALKGYLSQSYLVDTVHIFKDVLCDLDPIYHATRKRYSGEHFYNLCLKKQWTLFPNYIFPVIIWSQLKRKKSRQKILQRMLDYFSNQAQPDMLISVIPILNGIMRESAQLLDIPCVTVTTDLDSTLYAQDLHGSGYDQFWYTLAFDDPAMYAKISSVQLPKSHIKITGFPVRPDFFEIKNHKAIKKDFGVKEGRPVVMLLMGAVGSNELVTYVRALYQVSQPVHLLVCVGRNTDLKQKIESLVCPSHISMSIIGFTQRISDLMAISDVLVTKPGPTSICEALYSNVPLILDGTSRLVFWERFNLDFVQNNGFGDVVRDIRVLPSLVERYLSDVDYISCKKHNIAAFKKENFGEHITSIVQSILGV